MSGEVVHRLGVVVCVMAALGWLVFEAEERRRDRLVRRRMAALLAMERERRPRWRPAYGVWGRRWGGPLGAVVTGYVLVGGVAGGVVGLFAACGVWRWQRRRRPTGGGEKVGAGELPLAADLLAACVAAGASPREAAGAVGESLGGRVGEALAQTAAELRLGGEPARAWGRFGAIPGASALARCLERAGSTGAPAAGPVARLASGLRAEQARAARARAQRASVLITAPVGLCFLPAFLAVGVAPVVIGLASHLLYGN
ncbi:type II secretion system F family protein [Streptomyces sp. NBC_01465]|uniref:type II secretion system F family protein n=1 Tax=Streptomyces sp. NBC_01465 TaxID=2903878 RepID=UPI002E342372|nr:type II secretion system F family protein [Streptomyces sp. NBC_01465]